MKAAAAVTGALMAEARAQVLEGGVERVIGTLALAIEDRRRLVAIEQAQEAFHVVKASETQNTRRGGAAARRRAVVDP